METLDLDEVNPASVWSEMCKGWANLEDDEKEDFNRRANCDVPPARPFIGKTSTRNTRYNAIVKAYTNLSQELFESCGVKSA